MNLIKIACDVKDYLPLDSLVPFQGKLKSLSKEDYIRLRKEILETGFAFPISIWMSEGKSFLIGGHQRVRVLLMLRDEGYQLPNNSVPIVFTLADSFKQAKRRVMQDISQYGTVERQGMYEFLIEAQIDPGDLAESFKIPDVNIASFNSEFFLDDVTGNDAPEKQGSKELSEDDFSNFSHKCPRCSFEFD